MTAERLTAMLAERVMGWRVAPGRLMMGGRGWKPAWRFQPIAKREDAFRLLDAARPEQYSISARTSDGCTVHVVIGGKVGKANELTEPRAITYAVARAIGLEPVRQPSPKTGADSQ
jgi:hypothetical protein